ncbi:ABC transporter substrate-binding protein [Comamonas composti]|uniref:ABC transporter substrate-binding protein n=1 Tax=Comamonas composti TaxID=408558 RepID=UPI00042A882C|nr:ABC transporter substrate-binding protein [Comamonas composti]
MSRAIPDRRRWLGQALAAGLGSALAGPTALAQALSGSAADAVLAASFGRIPDASQLRRVFAAGPPASVLIAVLAPHKLLGWPQQLSDQARAHLGPALQNLPHLGRLSGRGSTMPLEALLQLQPDLVLDSGTADASHTSALQRLATQTGLPCVLVQGSLEQHARQLRQVGALLGEPSRGETLAAYAEAVAALTREVTQSLAPGQRPRVYLGRSSNGMETGLAGSINLELLEYAGGINVAAQAGRGGLTRVSMEQILAWNPEVIVTQEPLFAQRVRQDPLWRGVSAVRAGRVHCAPNWPFGWLDGPPSVNRLLGLRWMLSKLHPQAKALQGLPPLAQEVGRFYQLFYGAELTPAQLQQLMALAA